MDSTVRAALKEWAVVVDAIRRGDQLLVFRKGGIDDPAGRFTGEHRRFWLFPTAFHQQRERVVPSARTRLESGDVPLPTPTHVPVQVRCDVVEALELASLETALRLSDHHVLSDDTLRERFEWGGEHCIHVMILRAHRLPEPAWLELRPEYGGCRSWIELAEAPSEADLEPALSRSEFDSRLASIRSLLHSTRTEP